MGEQSGARHHRESGVGECVDHLVGPGDREEGVLLPPDQLNRDVDLTVEASQPFDMSRFDGPQHPPGCVQSLTTLVKGPQEELVELAVDQAGVDEAITQQKRTSSDPRSRHCPAKDRVEARQSAWRKEGLQASTEAVGLLAIDQAHRSQPRVAGHRMPCDQTPAVLTDQRHIVEPQQFDHAAFPQGAHPYIVNIDEVGRDLLWRLQRQVLQDPDDGPLRGVLDDILAMPTVESDWRAIDLSVPADPALVVHLRAGDVDLRFVTVVTAFEAPQNAAVEDITIEAWFPVDDATADMMRALANAG